MKCLLLILFFFRTKQTPEYQVSIKYSKEVSSVSAYNFRHYHGSNNSDKVSLGYHSWAHSFFINYNRIDETGWLYLMNDLQGNQVFIPKKGKYQTIGIDYARTFPPYWRMRYIAFKIGYQYAILPTAFRTYVPLNRIDLAFYYKLNLYNQQLFLEFGPTVFSRFNKLSQHIQPGYGVNASLSFKFWKQGYFRRKNAVNEEEKLGTKD